MPQYSSGLSARPRKRSATSGPREGWRGGIGAELLRRGGAAQYNVGPRLGQRGRQGQGIGVVHARRRRLIRAAAACGEGGSLLRAVSRPLASASLIDDAHSRGMGLLQRRAGRRFQQVPRRLHAVEEAVAGDAHVQRPLQRFGLVGPAQRQADLQPRSRSRASSSSTARLSSTPLSSVAEWIWYRSRCSPSNSRLSANWRRSTAANGP